MTVKNSHLVKSLTSSQKNQLFADRNEIVAWIKKRSTNASESSACRTWVFVCLSLSDQLYIIEDYFWLEKL